MIDWSKTSNDAGPLLAAWKRLAKKYPDSSWAMKVSFVNEAR